MLARGTVQLVIDIISHTSFQNGIACGLRARTPDWWPWHVCARPSLVGPDMPGLTLNSASLGAMHYIAASGMTGTPA